MNLEDLVSKALAKRPLEREKIKAKRKKNIFEKIPDIKDLILKRNSLAIKVMKLSLEKKDFSNEKEEFENIKNKINSLLLKNNFPIDYLENIYVCDICKDKGFFNKKVCKCIMKDVVKDRVLESGFLDKKRDKNFKNFNLSLFNGNCVISGQNVDINFYIKKLVDYTKEYCDNLNKKEFGLYFFGQSGSGKTYLASSMVNYLLDSGKRAKFITSSDLFDLFFNYSYSFYKDKIILKDTVNTIKTIDFLVIDDLGNESVTKNNNVFLSSILDERFERGVNTVITSNLSSFDLADIYDSRVSSRIRGNFKFFEFPSIDLRNKVFNKKL